LPNRTRGWSGAPSVGPVMLAAGATLFTLTVVEAVTRMRRSFSQITEVVSAAEQVWNEMTSRLDAVGGELGPVTPLAARNPPASVIGSCPATRI